MNTRRMQRFAMYAVAWLLLVVFCAPAHGQHNVVTVDHGQNSAAQQAKPYVILVSLDGFRYDYAQKYGAAHLQALAAHGASALQGMIPSYPSVTFPNHYTIVTGLYPEHHGVVAMRFYDPVRKKRYAYDDAKSEADGSWYGGVPLWSLAEQQGMRSACFFWPGSEAEIAGERPTYYLRYDSGHPDDKRVDQVIAWLRLPPAKRPHFITLYYSEVDSAGHEFGPESQKTQDAVHHVDDMIGRLENGLKTLNLSVDVIVVSDHGMETVQGDWINLDRYADLRGFETSGALLYAPNEEAAAKAYQQLKNASDKFIVYRRKDVPAELHYDTNPREGDPIVIATGPYEIRAHAPSDPAIAARITKGAHGYDPHKMKNMMAVFYAEGPDIRPGTTVAPFENVSIYPLIADILGLRMGTVDGNLRVLEGILRAPVPAQGR